MSKRPASLLPSDRTLVPPLTTPDQKQEGRGSARCGSWSMPQPSGPVAGQSRANKGLRGHCALLYAQHFRHQMCGLFHTNQFSNSPDTN